VLDIDSAMSVKKFFNSSVIKVGLIIYRAVIRLNEVNFGRSLGVIDGFFSNITHFRWI
jgi:hypothetical protein